MKKITTWVMSPKSKHYELWVLGKILILFAGLKPERRRVTFLRLQALLAVNGIDTGKIQ